MRPTLGMEKLPSRHPGITTAGYLQARDADSLRVVPVDCQRDELNDMVLIIVRLLT